MDCRVKPGNDHAWVGILCRWYHAVKFTPWYSRRGIHAAKFQIAARARAITARSDARAGLHYG